jgi:hypothetical protein
VYVEFVFPLNATVVNSVDPDGNRLTKVRVDPRFLDARGSSEVASFISKSNSGRELDRAVLVASASTGNVSRRSVGEAGVVPLVDREGEPVDGQE